MRVWVVNQHAYTPEMSAGIRHFALGKELIARGHDVLVIASSFYHKARVETRLVAGEQYRHEAVEGVPFLWLRTPSYRGNSPARLWSMLVYTKRVIRGLGLDRLEPPDVIIGSSPHPFAAFAAERLARRYDVPFVFETRDLWPSRLVESGDLSALNPLILTMGWLERYLYRWADHVLTAVPIAPHALAEVEAYVADRGGRTEDLTWIPNGIHLTEAIPEPTSNGGMTTFLYAGAHSRYADLDVLLDAASILKDRGWHDRIRILLYGDGPEKGRLVSRAASESLSNVHFRDPVPKKEMPKVLELADAFVMTCRDGARWGMSPSKLYEYMAAGRPVVYAMGREYSPVERAGAGLSVEPSDPEGLADAMVRLTEMPRPLRAEMAERGRRYALEHHSVGALGARLEEVLTEVVSKGRLDKGGRNTSDRR